MIKAIRRVVPCILLLYFVSAVAIFFFQRSFIYFPTEYVSHSYEEMELKNDGETLRIIVLNPGKAEAVLYFGGNAEAVVYSADIFKETAADKTVYW